MRKSILTVLLCSFVLLPLSAQNQIDINELLSRLDENHMGRITDVFTPEELDVLTAYKYQAITPTLSEPSILRRRGFSTESVGPAEVIKVNPADLSNLESLGLSPLTEFEGAGFNIRQVNKTVIVDNANRIHLRGINNNNYQYTGMNVNVMPGESITGLERLSTGEVFAIGTNGSNSSHLYKLDTNNWSTTLVGSNNGLKLPLCLARTPNDQLVVLDGDDDNMYGVNAVSGIVNLIGPAGFDANFGQGMAYDADVNMVLLTAFNNTTVDSELRSLDTTTGMTTLIGIITPGTLDQFGFVDWTDEDSLGTNSEAFESFQYYPNPANEVLNLKAGVQIDHISIVDITGKQVLRRAVDALNAEINIAALSNGLYILNVEIDGRSASYKFVKD
ncbi:MAG: T9SS C-terminal target domain-containing protein [Flavobacterium sp.]|nr:MAG: T9SS C-terminal target domain-containing protein [Flavobacterium sp.]